MHLLGLNPVADLRRHAVEHADLVLAVTRADDSPGTDPRPDATTTSALRRPVPACAPASC